MAGAGLRTAGLTPTPTCFGEPSLQHRRNDLTNPACRHCVARLRQRRGHHRASRQGNGEVRREGRRRAGEGIFPPQRSALDGRGNHRRPAGRLRRDCRHAGGSRQGLGRHRPARRRYRQGGRQGRAQARSVDVLHRLFQAGRARRRPADHLPVQRRARLVDGVAAHGRIRPGARRDAGPAAYAGRALHCRE